METIENSFFLWMENCECESFTLENLNDWHGFKMKRWKCIWDSKAGTHYTYHAWITWVNEDDKFGYYKVYVNGYPGEEREDIDTRGTFDTEEEFKKAFDKELEEHFTLQVYMEEQKKLQKEASEAYKEYLNPKTSIYFAIQSKDLKN